MKRLGIATLGVVALLMVAIAIPAFGTQPEDYPTNWQDECQAYRNHSGYISSYYDYAVFFEQGQEPIELHTNGQPLFLEPPDGVSWDRVYKCHYSMETTTTTTGETTTTTGQTTTTGGESTTTTELSSTTTDPGDSTTTSGGDSTTTTDPELPFTGPSLSWPMWAVIAGFLILGGGGAVFAGRRDG